jgi:predicted XRE-type DNA-binding protein
MKAEAFDNVWDALCDTPGEAANMKARSQLLIGIREQVKTWNLPEERAAARLSLTRPRLNDLMRGKIEKFSLDALVNIATAAGYVLQIKLRKAA